MFILIFISSVIIFALYKKVPVFESFTEGAKQGLRTLLQITPTLVGLIVAVNLLKASTAFDALSSLFSPLSDRLGFPEEIVPMVLLRPVSGSGATALLTGIYRDYSPDSFAGRVASVLAGSTETTFFAIALYFGAVKVKSIRHTLLCALSADFTAFVMAVVSVRLMF